MRTLEIGRANVKKCSGQFASEQKTAYIGIRLYKIVNAGGGKQRFNLDSFTQFFGDIREIQLSIIKKFGFLAHDQLFGIVRLSDPAVPGWPPPTLTTVPWSPLLDKTKRTLLLWPAARCVRTNPCSSGLAPPAAI